jgi:hypothetical protein
VCSLDAGVDSKKFTQTWVDALVIAGYLALALGAERARSFDH